MVSTLCFSLAQKPGPPFFLLYYAVGLIQRSWKMGERKPKLLVRLQMKGHGPGLINSYDARAGGRPLALYTLECALVNI